MSILFYSLVCHRCLFLSLVCHRCLFLFPCLPQQMSIPILLFATDVYSYSLRCLFLFPCLPQMSIPIPSDVYSYSLVCHRCLFLFPQIVYPIPLFAIDVPGLPQMSIPTCFVPHRCPFLFPCFVMLSSRYLNSYMKTSLVISLQCPYRHSNEARKSLVACLDWLDKRCLNVSCPYRHPGGKEPAKSM